MFIQGGYYRTVDSIEVNNVMTKGCRIHWLSKFMTHLALAFAGFVAPNEEIHASVDQNGSQHWIRNGRC